MDIRTIIIIITRTMVITMITIMVTSMSIRTFAPFASP